MKRAMATLCLVALIGCTAYAQSPVNKRQNIQRERIKQGVRSGELTRPEAQGLAKLQAKIRRAETKAKKDGEVTAQERLRLDHLQDKANRRILKQKNDRQDR